MTQKPKRTAAKPSKPKRSRRRKKLTLADYLEAGLGRVPDADIARKLKVTRQAVGKIRLAAGIELPPPPPFDEAAWVERLGAAQVEGLTARKLAEQILAERAKGIGADKFLDLEDVVAEVRAACKACGLYLKRTKVNEATWRPAWNTVDWTKGNAQLAKDLSTPEVTVHWYQIAAWRSKLRKQGYKVAAAPTGYNARVE